MLNILCAFLCGLCAYAVQKSIERNLFGALMTKGAIQRMNGGFHLSCGNACSHHTKIAKEVVRSGFEGCKFVV